MKPNYSMFIKFFILEPGVLLGKLVPRKDGIEVYDRYEDDTSTRLFTQPLIETIAFLIKYVYSENIDKTRVISIILPDMKPDPIKESNFQIKLIEKIYMVTTPRGKSYLDRKYFDVINLKDVS